MNAPITDRPDDPGPSRPRIAHLLIWTVGCSVGLAAYRSVWPPMNERVRFVGTIYLLGMGMAFGTILTGVALLTARRGHGGPAMPGHRLLWFGLAAAVANVLAIVAYEATATHLFRQPREGAFAPYWTIYQMASAPTRLDTIHQGVGWGLGSLAALAFVGSVARRFGWSWLAVFLAFFSTSAILAGGMIRASTGSAAMIAWGRRAYVVYAWLIGLCVMALLSAVASDLRNRRRRDGLHWLGVAAWLGIAAVQWLACAYVP